jgi:putative transcriptional regulator
VNKKLFAELVQSMTQMNEIVRGERAPSREFHVAALLHVNVGTLRNWEQGLREPTGPAKALLIAISRDPTHVLKALAA